MEIAKKRRHLFLLSKVNTGKPLTEKELRELSALEAESEKNKSDKTTKSKSKPAGTGGKKNKQLSDLARELKSIGLLDSQFEDHFDLEKYPRVKAALENAVSQRIEDIIKQRFAGPAQTDYRKVTLMQLIDITVRSRRTIYDWLERGLPREADGNFWLPSFLKWFEKYTVEKLPARVVNSINPFQQKKAERLDIVLKKEKHELLDRTEVITGQIARHQNLINALRHKAEELAMLAHGQPQRKITKLINDFFDNILSQQCQVPESLKLSDEKTKLLEELLEGLVSESG